MPVGSVVSRFSPPALSLRNATRTGHPLSDLVGDLAGGEQDPDLLVRSGSLAGRLGLAALCSACR